MLFSVDKNTFLDSLEKAAKACGKSSMPILSGVLINVEESKISLTCSDSITTISSEFSVLSAEKGSILVNAKILLDYVKKLNNGEISLKAEDEFLKIKCGKSHSKIALMAIKDYPKINKSTNETTERIKAKISQGDLKKAIKEVQFAVSLDESRPILTGICMEVKENSLTLVALDGYRVAAKAISIECAKNFKCVIPAKTASELQKTLVDDESQLEFVLEEKTVTFKLGETTVNSLLLEGEFIDFKSVIPKDNNIHIKINTKEFEQSLSRVALMADNSSASKLTKLVINTLEKKLLISASNSIGNSEDELEILECDGKDLSIAFNVKYLQDVLSIIDEENIVIMLSSPVSPIIIEKFEDKSFRSVVLPVRLLEG